MSAITADAWQVLEMVNETTDEDGRIRHLPYPGSLVEQPPWYRQSVKIKRGERNSDWFREEMNDWMERQRKKRGKE